MRVRLSPREKSLAEWVLDAFDGMGPEGRAELGLTNAEYRIEGDELVFNGDKTLLGEFKYRLGTQYPDMIEQEPEAPRSELRTARNLLTKIEAEVK